jgi:hypothetical protein
MQRRETDDDEALKQMAASAICRCKVQRVLPQPGHSVSVGIHPVHHSSLCNRSSQKLPPLARRQRLVLCLHGEECFNVNLNVEVDYGGLQVLHSLFCLFWSVEIRESFMVLLLTCTPYYHSILSLFTPRAGALLLPVIPMNLQKAPTKGHTYRTNLWRGMVKAISFVAKIAMFNLMLSSCLEPAIAFASQQHHSLGLKLLLWLAIYYAFGLRFAFDLVFYAFDLDSA